jgi:hypothetical protein
LTTKEDPIYPRDVFVGLTKLASSLQQHKKTACATVMTFAWGLINRRTPKTPKPAVAVVLTTPRLDLALTKWRNERLQGIFKTSHPPSTSTVDLCNEGSSSMDVVHPPTSLSNKPVDLASVEVDSANVPQCGVCRLGTLASSNHDGQRPKRRLLL